MGKGFWLSTHIAHTTCKVVRLLQLSARGQMSEQARLGTDGAVAVHVRAQN